MTSRNWCGDGWAGKDRPPGGRVSELATDAGEAAKTVASPVEQMGGGTICASIRGCGVVASFPPCTPTSASDGWFRRVDSIWGC